MSEHSFWVTVIAYQLGLLKGFSPEDFLRLLVEALFHDKEESITSDLPALVKRGRSWDEVEELARQELGLRAHFLGADMPKHIKQVIKIADLVAAYLYVAEEMKMGNWEYFEQIRGELITLARERAENDKDLIGYLNAVGMTPARSRKPIKEISHL